MTEINSAALTIMLVQHGVSQSKTRNVEIIRKYAAEAAAQGADLVVFPEGMMVAAAGNPDLAADSESLNGQFTTAVCEAASANGIAIVAGMFESSGDGRVYNTLIASESGGSLVAVYRKIHLYDAFAYRESDTVIPGDVELVTFTCSGMTVGLMTCYDLRFPELARALVLEQSAHVLVVPAAWANGPLKEDHWTVLSRARALENTVYLAVCDEAGAHTCGLSMVIDPAGVVTANAGEIEGSIKATMTRLRIEQARSMNPSLRNVRMRRTPSVG